MTLVSQIVTDAYRESNLIAISATPTTAEQTEALRLLNRIVKSVLGYELGQKFQPFALGKTNRNTPAGYPYYGDTPGSTWVPNLNTRLVCNLAAATTIDLHPAPQDGARLGVVDVSGNFNTFNLVLRGNGSLIDGATTLTLSVDSVSSEWFFRADTQQWMITSDLALIDTFPIPEEFDDMFLIMLAMRLNPRHGQSLTPESKAALSRSRSQFRSRYNQTRQMHSDIGLLRMSEQTNGPDRYDDYGFEQGFERFASGYPY